jgi:hypothetical protein
MQAELWLVLMENSFQLADPVGYIIIVIGRLVLG